MLKYLFLIYGACICLLFGYASYTGWFVAASVAAGSFSPRGHSTIYHK